MEIEETKLATRTEKALVTDRRRFQPQDQLDPVALAQMTDEAREALVHARPKAEFAIQPVLSPEELAAIHEALDEFDIVPPREWLLVWEMPAAERKGHILMPEVVTAEARPTIGIVIAVGAGKIGPTGVEIPPDMARGHHVTFPTFCGVTMKFGGVKLLQLRQDEVMNIARRPGGRAVTYSDVSRTNYPEVPKP